MNPIFGRLGTCAFVASLSAGVVLLACGDSEDPTGSTLNLGDDASILVPSETVDGSTFAADAAVADAAPTDDIAAFEGIWHGVGTQGAAQWTILADIHGGARGSFVGVMTYPSLGCAGTLTRFEDLDAGADAGEIDASVDGGGASVTLREVVSNGTCIPVGDDSFTLLPNGDLAFRYRVTGDTEISATGTLTKVGSRQASTTPPLGIWANGAPDPSFLWPLLGTISQTDTVGAPVGVFARAVTSTTACDGLWTLSHADGNRLTLLEVLTDGNIGCPSPATIRVTLEADGGLTYERPDDAGADAAVPLVRH